jgi:hypothetical protein
MILFLFFLSVRLINPPIKIAMVKTPIADSNNVANLRICPIGNTSPLQELKKAHPLK